MLVHEPKLFTHVEVTNDPLKGAVTVLDTPKQPPDDDVKPKPETVPVDGQAQEEAGKIREESGGYD